MGNTESPGALFPHPKSSLRSSAIPPPHSKSSMRPGTLFSPAQNLKLCQLFGNDQISSPHYHETHFYTILKYFKHLKKGTIQI